MIVVVVFSRTSCDGFNQIKQNKANNTPLGDV